MAFTGPAMTKKEAAEAVRAAKAQLGLTWAQLAEAVGRPVAWATAALLGQHPMSTDEAAAAVAVLELDKDVDQALRLSLPAARSTPRYRPTPPSTASTRYCRCTARRSRNSSTRSSATAS